MPKPVFFVFDGVDGAGKTTQIQRLRQWLSSQGHTVQICRDPGTTDLGEKIRQLLLDPHGVAIGLRAEMLLYMAARAQLVEEIVRPALLAGKSVISDRFLLANVVYQGHAGGLDPALLWQIGETATAGIRPTLTFVLDIDPSEAARRQQMPPDRLEQRGRAYFQRVRQGFLDEARRDAAGIAVIDANQTPDQVAAAVRQAAHRAMGSARETPS